MTTARTPGVGFRPRGVQRLDAGVRMGAAQHLGMEQPGQLDVSAVLGPAGNLVDSVGTYGTFADDVVFNFGYHLIRGHGYTP